MTYLHTLPLFFYFVLCPWKHIIHVSFYHLKRHFLPWIHVLQEINYKINDTFFSHNLLQISWTYTFFYKPDISHYSLYCILLCLCYVWPFEPIQLKMQEQIILLSSRKNFIIINIIVYHYHYLQSACISFTTPSSHLHALSNFMMITGETVYIRINIYIIP